MKKTPKERFFKFVKKTKSCWIWLGGKAGGKNSDYGVFWNGKKHVYAHRFSYELFKKKIKKDLQIDHLCRNRACVNPKHLEEVTQRENILRGEGLVATNAKKTHCKRGHAFTPENTFFTSEGYRQCLTCQKIRDVTKFANQRVRKLSRTL